MYYARVGIYQFQLGTAQQVRDQVNGTLIPELETMSGFIDYRLVTTPDSRGLSMSVWQTEKQAIASVAYLENWVTQNISHLVIRREAYIGEVGLMSDAGLGKHEPVGPGASVVNALYEAFNRGDRAGMEALCHPAAMADNIAFGLRVPLQDYFANWLDAFSDANIGNVEFTAQGDRVFAEFVGTGTHTGTLQTPDGPMAPTGRHVSERIGELYVMRNDKVASLRIYFDRWAFLERLRPDIGEAAARIASEQPQAPH